MSDAASLAAAFAEAFVGEVPDAERLGAALEAALAEAHEAWPGITTPDADLIASLAGQIDPLADPVAALAELRRGDLLLASACLHGDDAALRHFESHCLAAAAGVLRRMEKEGSLADDVIGHVRTRLLVNEGPGTAKLADYQGRGDLRAWVRVVAMRSAMDTRRKHHREVVADDDSLADAAAPIDPELSFLKGQYQQAFKAAFHDALAELETEERSLLRSRLLDDLSIDDLGVLYGIHRSTAARRLEQVRTRLQKRTKQILSQRLQLTPSEFRSVARLVLSHFDASIRRVLSE